MSTKKPTIGRIVIYKTTKKEQAAMQQQHGVSREELPAVIVATFPTFDDADRRVSLKVFQDGNLPDLYRPETTRGDHEGTWHWPVIESATSTTTKPVTSDGAQGTHDLSTQDSQGLQGPQGKNGPDDSGVTGVQGVQGKSEPAPEKPTKDNPATEDSDPYSVELYEVAVKEGFAGSWAEWVHYEKTGESPKPGIETEKGAHKVNSDKKESK